jgi:glutamine synthetase
MRGSALEDFRNAFWTLKLLGEDVKARYSDLKQSAVLATLAIP